MLLLLLGVSQALAADLHRVSFEPARYTPGDSYALFLQTVTDTEAHLKGGTVKSYWEDVELRYSAAVVIEEVDLDGAPVRERHENAQLTYQRPHGDTGTLFSEGVSLDVHRETRGSVTILYRGERLERKVERVVAEVLSTQLEFGRGPHLFTPENPILVGDTWDLDRSIARKFLRDLGVRAIQVGRGAKATLRRSRKPGYEHDLAIHYSIPITRLTLDKAPKQALVADSEGLLEGEIRLPAHPSLGRLDHTSRLHVRVQGSLRGAGAARPWIVQSGVKGQQRTRIVKKQLRDTGFTISLLPSF